MAVVENFPFIATKVVRQTQSDHDAIILDLWGRKLKDYPKDNRLYFKFDVCWVGDEETRNIIERAWNRKGTDYRDKIERVRSALGLWQYGFGWQIGNGETINIRADNWGMEGLNEDVITRNTLNQNEKSVKDFWHADSRSWNANKVKKVYGQDWGDKICNIPIRDEGQADKMIWFHNPHGCFTSKSVYSWLLLKEMGYGPHRTSWTKSGKKPLKDFIKINFDTTVGENRIGYGTAIRDEEGFVLGGGGGFKEGRLSMEEAECMAFEESIKLARMLNIKEHVFFETDHVGLVNRLKNVVND
ncbi:hypothetical protein Godav_005897 [Gossypium davidsonii]|uniref:RNase H type-1 domain-containing protein n=1 Tax=Gossypium davidsonii TaxID=34287 RepID=A0A7J8S2W4_GOSDV|nr:hypothetical protein [Gossypium davidsonii]